MSYMDTILDFTIWMPNTMVCFLNSCSKSGPKIHKSAWIVPWCPVFEWFKHSDTETNPNFGWIRILGIHGVSMVTVFTKKVRFTKQHKVLKHLFRFPTKNLPFQAKLEEKRWLEVVLKMLLVIQGLTGCSEGEGGISKFGFRRGIENQLTAASDFRWSWFWCRTWFEIRSTGC